MTSTTTFCCTECQREFKSEKALRAHKSIAHNPFAGSPASCIKCQKVVANSNRTSHISACQETGEFKAWNSGLTAIANPEVADKLMAGAECLPKEGTGRVCSNNRYNVENA